MIIENQALVFHSENIEIGNHVYAEHQTILEDYYKNKMIIEKDAEIGKKCFFILPEVSILKPRQESVRG